jgi:protein disulfide-isomerase A6
MHVMYCIFRLTGREGYLKELRAVSAKYKGKGISFVWVEAGEQEALANTLEIGGAGYPAAAVISAKKLKYTGYQGAFNSDGLNTWVGQVLAGRGAKLVSLSAVPAIQTTKPWDGKDGQLPSDEL